MHKNNHGDNSIIPLSMGKRNILFVYALLSTDNTCASYFRQRLTSIQLLSLKNSIFSVRSQLFLQLCAIKIVKITSIKQTNIILNCFKKKNTNFLTIAEKNINTADVLQSSHRLKCVECPLVLLKPAVTSVFFCNRSRGEGMAFA